MKRLEGEVTALLEELGEDQASLGLSGHTVDPHQFLGIELNPWAAAVAELVLWIGYLQWHFRTHGMAAPSEPVLKDFKNIENRDAVLEWSERKPRLDEAGNPVTRWDGVTTLRHPVTGEEVPDPEARIQVYDYAKPKPAAWPEATFIVGNPPFIGTSRMREALGDGYVEALWQAYSEDAAKRRSGHVLVGQGGAGRPRLGREDGKGTRRFGLITTNSLRQTFNRRVLEPHLNDQKKPLSLLFAIPDHPWVDTQFGAAVRIAMTVGAVGNRSGQLLTIASESKESSEAEGQKVSFNVQTGKLHSNLRIGADLGSTVAMNANESIAYQGVIPGGEGFRIGLVEAQAKYPGYLDAGLLKRYLNGQQLINGDEPGCVIDFFDLSKDEAKKAAPELFQQVLDKVKPYRDTVKRKTRREKWWLYAEANSTMRPMFKGVNRYIATCRTAKHRIFVFLDADILPDAKLIAIGLQEGSNLAVLSSRFHVTWAMATGANLGVGNDSNYNHARVLL